MKHGLGPALLLLLPAAVLLVALQLAARAQINLLFRRLGEAELQWWSCQVAAVAVAAGALRLLALLRVWKRRTRPFRLTKTPVGWLRLFPIRSNTHAACGSCLRNGRFLRGMGKGRRPVSTPPRTWAKTVAIVHSAQLQLHHHPRSHSSAQLRCPPGLRPSLGS